MAQVDVQWPSEDEDFDAVTDGVGDATDFDKDDGIDPGSDSAAPSEASVEPAKADSELADKEPESPAEAEPGEGEPEPKSETEEEETEATEDAEPASHDDPEPVPTEEAAPDPTPEHEVLAEASIPQEQSAPKPPKVKKAGSVSRTILEVILVAGVIGLGLWSWNLYTDNKNLKQQVSQLNNNPQVAVQKQTQSLIDKVGQLMQLPTNETPTVASVSDAAQAKQQSAFFDNAQNGDKVLMYVKAGEAILYRPSTNKIILVAPLTFTSNSTTGSSSTATTPKTTATK